MVVFLYLLVPVWDNCHRWHMPYIGTSTGFIKKKRERGEGKGREKERTMGGGGGAIRFDSN